MKTFMIIFTAVISVALPVGLMIYWKKKNKLTYVPFATGALGFSIFANILETFAHTYFLYLNKTTAAFFKNNLLAYGIYAALMAGLFEETGRYVCFKFLMKKKKNKADAIAYGIGHGGAECILTLGSTYLLYSIVALGGSIGDPASDATALATINNLQISLIPIAILERIFALMVQIGLSVLVYKAHLDSKDFYLFPLAIFLHMLIDIPAGLYQAGILTSITLVEILVGVLAIAIFVYCMNVYRKMENENARV